MLTKWQEGETWFWDTLVDADAASNAMNWQWVAGSGIDAAPYFRILNPALQGEKFDGQGDYVRHLVPEIAKLPNAYVQHPWDAPEDVLKEAQITLGKDYSKPCIDIKEGRARAMKAFEDL
ncbi:MAG: FAD-binding domain-containing protein [Acetobacteraceae bacterium]